MQAIVSPTAMWTVEEIQKEFEIERDMVSKEIGKRMLEGWTLLDLSCPNCVMPLMTNTEGQTEICMLCGTIGKEMNSDAESGLEPEDAGSMQGADDGEKESKK